jgi:hypothetical protein
VFESSCNPPGRRERRRWFQFGLRALLLVMAVAAALVAWQRERLAQWVESLWRVPFAEVVRDPRDPTQVATEFFGHFLHDEPDEAMKLLSSKARDWVRQHPRGWSSNPQPKRDAAEDKRPVTILDTRTFADGTAHVDAMIVIYQRWRLLLRHEPEGWRVTGLILPAGSREGLKIDFEDEASSTRRLPKSESSSTGL